MKDKLGNVIIMLGIAAIMVFAVVRDPAMSRYGRILVTKGPAAVVAQYKLDNAPKAEPTLDEINEEAAKELLSLINALRQKNGLGKLTLDKKLCEVARYRAELMKQHDKVGHDIPGEGLPDATLKRMGVSYSLGAENVALHPDRESVLRTAGSVHTALSESPGHLENMLIPGIRKLGVGVAVYNNTLWYVCEVFIAP